MKRKIFLLSCCLFSCISIYANDSLRYKIAQMLIIGFRGTTLSPKNHIYRDIKDLHIGGVVLFDYDVPTKSYNRNILLPSQLQKLCQDLQKLANDKLFIAIDYEGGKVNRLKTSRGFKPTVSAQYLGELNNVDSTTYYASRYAEQLKMLGFNINFAPCVDVNVNPSCPVIGKLQRSFSSSPDDVYKHARIWITEHHKQNILTSLKHFPGHGSSDVDTHLGIADVTATWNEKIELLPYRKLIADKLCDIIMVAHVVNRSIDSDYPASLSKNTITGIIRNKLKFNGVVITDDIDMGAVAHNYSMQIIFEKSINAGADMLIIGNNDKFYDELAAVHAIDIIERLVLKGIISTQRIDEAYNRIILLKKRISNSTF